MMEQEARAPTASRPTPLWGMPRQFVTIQRKLRRFAGRRPLGAAGLAVVLFWVIVAVAAPLATPGHDPYVQDYTIALRAPGAGNWLGTDQFGRDLYARVVYGSRISLVIAFTAVAAGVRNFIGPESVHRQWTDPVRNRGSADQGHTETFTAQ